MKSIILALLCLGSAVESERPQPLDAETVARLVRELDAADYQARSRATRQLAQGGAEVVELLKPAMTEGSLERRYRALDVLGKIYSRGDADSFDAIEVILDLTSRNPNTSLAATAQNLLEANYETRQRLAIADIQKLGGKILHSAPREVGPPGDADPERELPRNIVSAVILDQEWKGGDDGLKHVKRLTRLTFMYRVKAANISDEAIQDLSQALPGLTIEVRGGAYFGITGSRLVGAGERCRISSVSPGGPAANAGIQPEDVILQFDGLAVKDFTQLIDLIATKSPHDKIAVALERNGQPLNVTVELLPWPKSK
jgi:hypothetical protein